MINWTQKNKNDLFFYIDVHKADASAADPFAHRYALFYIEIHKADASAADPFPEDLGIYVLDLAFFRSIF